MSKLVAVQALRAIAALSIALLHGQHEAGLIAGRAPALGERSFPWEAGVDVFFVISGFVMVYASGELFGRPGAPGAFLLRRVARVVPLYWLATSLFLAVVALRPGLVSDGGAATPATIAASYLFVPLARPDGTIQPVYSLGWTLNYEMFFYAVFALAIGLRRRVAVALAGTLLAVLVLLGLSVAPSAAPLRFWSDPILVEFGVGMGLGLARAEGATLATPARAALAVIGIALLALIGQDLSVLGGPTRALYLTVPAACLVAACGLARPRPAREAGLPVRWASALGDASYAIYLLHPFVIRGVRESLRVAGLEGVLPPMAFVAMGLAATCAVALAVHRAIERPATRWVRGRLGRGRGESAEARRGAPHDVTPSLPPVR